MINFNKLKPKDHLIRSFEYNPILFEDVNTYFDSSGTRIYQTSDGDYPSVTSVIGAVEDKSYLDVWRDRIGLEEANKITERSAERGERMHNILEKAINGDTDCRKEGQGDREAIIMAEQIAAKAFPDISEVLISESPVWSNTLKIAGRTDCAAKLKDGSLAIVDFKNSRKVKKIDDIGGYLIQATLYAHCIYEMTGLLFDKIRIMMALSEDGLGGCLQFDTTYQEHIDDAKELVKNYYARK